MAVLAQPEDGVRSQATALRAPEGFSDVLPTAKPIPYGVRWKVYNQKTDREQGLESMANESSGRIGYDSDHETTWSSAVKPHLILVASLLFVGVGPMAIADDLARLRQLAEEGDTEAKLHLGRLYANGEEVTKDLAKAARWFRDAAEQGNVEAQDNLGLMYHLGEGVPKNMQESARWFRLAARQGSRRAQFFLGGIYHSGEGVMRDYKEAAKYFRMAANQGHPGAQATLGAMYAAGTGVLLDAREAARLYLMAAEQRDILSFSSAIAKAQYNLGVMHIQGKGVEKDFLQGYMWLKLAVSVADDWPPERIEKAVQLRQLVAQRMKPDQIAEANQRVLQWWESRQE